MTTSKIPIEARIYNLIDVSIKLNAAKISIKKLASAISRRTLSTNVHITVNFHKFIHQQYLIRRSYRYHMQPNTNRAKIEFKIWLNKNVKINSLRNARSFAIIIRSHTHVHTHNATFLENSSRGTNTTHVTKIIATVPLNNASKLRQRQRSMSSERGGDEGEGAEGMESLEEPLRQSKPSLRRESRQGTREH